MGELSQLKGLGLSSEKRLNEVGIFTRQQLSALGAIHVFITLEKYHGKTPSLNFLYALVGAIEDIPWQQVAQQERERLLIELASAREFNALLLNESDEQR
ncbi:hypothetical protein tinsulaeT_31900 [Thalassotalea insulae]|uniref:TfoX C-terminal domain-containing protein n=1 Tax=Thalassotalea insulae TaxID=2056778 RepID=A0ABQ6GYN3_9GAMM|nr:TfoX/Sxy family DNA transformation protein [Thalassotalea insulae]GLX79850.1 hypothetical protein tinsulaeT_31900 [Thalassotalea insulae]